MKLKYKPIIMTIIIGLLISLSYRFYERQQIDKFVSYQIDTQLDEVQLNSYQQELEEYLSNITNRTQLKNYYYVKGYLEYLDERYRESNESFLQALEIDFIKHDEIETALYLGISTNYYLLGDEETALLYFEKAKEFAIKKNNDELLANVYQSRVRMCLADMVNLQKAQQLLEETLQLDVKPLQKIESYFLLSEVNLLMFDYEALISHSFEAYKLAEQLNQETLSNHALLDLGIGYYLRDSDHQAIEIFKYLLSLESVSNYDQIVYFLSQAIYEQYGYDEAITQLEIYENEIGSQLAQLLKLTFLIKDARYEEAQYYLEDGRYISSYPLSKRIMSSYIQEQFGEESSLVEDYQVLMSHFSQQETEYILYFGWMKSLLDQQLITQSEIIDLLEGKKIQSMQLLSYEIYELIFIEVKRKFFYQQVVAVSCLIAGITLLIKMGYDVFEMKFRKADLIKFKCHDELIHTLTYESLEDKFNGLVCQGQRIELILFELPKFPLNDIDDFLQRNKILKKVACLLQNSFDNGFVCRLKDCQFLVCLIDCEYDLDSKVQRVLDEVEGELFKDAMSLAESSLRVKVKCSSTQFTAVSDLADSIEQMQDMLWT